MNWFQKLLSNPFLLIGLSSWFWAQLIKTIIHAIVTKSIDFTRLIGDGGMPSGHSATVSSLATAAALVYGLGSFEFAMAFIFAIVVCKDAMGVRLETGRQAVIINDIVEAFNSLASEKLPEAKHIFSHIEWHMNGILLHVPAQDAPAGCVWASREALQAEYTLPGAFKSYKKLMV